MRGRSLRGLLALSTGVASLWACTESVPTLPESGDLAPGASPTTIQHVLSAAEVVASLRVAAGETTAQSAPYRLVANDFDGALTARTLATFRQFPDTVNLIDSVDSTFTFIGGEVIALIPDTLQVSAALLDFQLWTVTQPWDTLAVSWENAVDVPGAEVPWTTPGGARGELLEMARWERSASSDSIVWPISADVVNRLAAGTIPGLMVTLFQPNSRTQISPLSIRVSIQPTANADTVLTRTVAPGPHDFIFTPEPPQPDDVLRVGGLTSDRSYIQLDLSQPIPLCAGGAVGCDEFASPLEVSLNRVELLLDPVPVTSGYRPIRPLEFEVRRVLEPELGDRAPLGPVIAVDSLFVEQAAGADDSPVAIDLTAAVERLLRDEETQLALALMLRREAPQFSYAWFQRNPRLRFVYTLPLTPDLP